MNSEPLDKKYEAFGWNVIRINGNDISQIIEAINNFKNEENRPTVIVADTIAGKGGSFL